MADLGDSAREYAERFGQGDTEAAADVQLQAKMLEMLAILSENVSALQKRMAALEAPLVADLSQLSVEELRQLRALLSKMYHAPNQG